ncbi:S1C family serine protease [Microbacterium amylolyticum]|uniref:Serine protease PepD n=1 Tax=Microbacterium amylolyticum TaxID=936337 RepID=A0ABS4ZKQ2_9MICO|nr:trypsin-like peptidase domain-containing protein [Microbacterium amylolyticum]MBP2437792.1 putative serine protease PepD [Microbacterium amylolyticum]
MSNDNATPVPPLPERSAAEAAASAFSPAASSPPATSAFPEMGPPNGAPHPPAHEPVYQWAPAPPAKPVAKKGLTSGKVTALVLAAVLFGGGAGFGGAWIGGAFGPGASSAVVSSDRGTQGLTINNPSDVNETAAIAAAALPSVVTLEVGATDGSSAGSGSGVILSEDGYVLTNTHVATLGGSVADPAIRVTAADGKLYNATIVGTDPTYDLAVIKLEGASGLTPIEFADSAELNVGDTSVAIGAPMGLANTVTTGVISNLNRSIEIASSAAPDDTESSDSPDGENLPWFFDIPGQETPQQPQTSETIKIAVLQTDAAINPGNSGGALVDSDGKLIGINVAIATARSTSEEGGSIGLGFAIPSNIAQRVANEIIDNGFATHGLLGASVRPASSVQGTTTTGAYVAEAVDGGAAAAGGLQEGDVITHFNGVRVSDAIDITAQVRAAAAGSEATVRYMRDGEEFETTVTLGALE